MNGHPRQWFLLLVCWCVVFTSCAWARSYAREPWPPTGSVIEVAICDERGRTFPTWPTLDRYHRDHSQRRLYVEAERGAEYQIRVRNLTGERIAVIVAVDGRNIISGERSYLVRSNERMYVLQAYESRVYTGWRSSRTHVNRFYFTDAGDSYAAAWGDMADTGVIALAAFRERRAPSPPPDLITDAGRQPRAALKSPGPAASRAGVAAELKARERDSRAGTGYGESTYSPSRTVEFDAENYPAEKVFIKYEWPDVLERQGIKPSDRSPRTPHWNDAQDGQYAPRPPRPH